LNKKELDKLTKTCDKIFDSDEAKARRKKQDRFLKYYTGAYWPQEPNDDEAKESEIHANLIFSTVMTIAPMLTDNKPIWSIRSRTPHFQPIADLYKAAGDSIWCMEEMDTKIFKAVIDALTMQYAIVQVVFDPDKSIRGEVVVENVDPRTYFQAPGFEDNWDAPFCGTKVKRTLWWVRKMYPDTGKDVKPDSLTEKNSLAKAAAVVSTLVSGKEDHEYFHEEASVYTLWMRDDSVIDVEEDGKKKKKLKYPNGRMIVFTKDVVLDDREYPYNHGKPPWVFLYDYIIPHSVYGLGEADQIEGLTLEYNLFLRRFAKHCRIYSNKCWTVPDNWSTDIEDFKNGMMQGDHAWSIPPGADPPKQIAVQPFDQSTLNFINGLPTIVQDVSGVTETSKGMASKKQRQSAHEITALLETSYTRTRQRVRNLEAFIKRVYILVVELMQQFYNEPREFSLRNGNNENEWYNIQNTPEFTEKLMRPEQERPEGPPREGEEEDQKLLEQQWQDYDALMKAIADEESVYFKFDIDIETNSTLPMDQQSMANMALQISQQGRMDTLTLLEILHIPNPERIVERLKKEAAEKQAGAQGPPGAAPAQAAMMGGPNVGPNA
jgi:hypothetical protein